MSLLKNKLYTINFRQIFTVLLVVIGCIILLLALTILFIIVYEYSQTTELIKSPNDINSISTSLTSSVGSIISGTVGVMFSFCSVVFFILALLYQQNELKLQRKEIRENRKIVQIQAFESTFFNLLKVQQDIRERISKIIKPDFYRIISNSNFIYWDFEKLYESFKSIATADLKDYGEQYILTKKDDISFDDYLWNNYRITEGDFKESPRLAAYKRFFHSNQSILGNYHRNLFHTLKYIYEAETTEEFEEFKESEIKVNIWLNGEHIMNNEIYTKYRKYADFVQAQMSSDELALLFYNGLIFPKMKYLINHYQLLENLPPDYLVHKTDANFYIEDENEN